MMPCEDVRNLIEAHLDETLDEPTRHAVTTHLKTCPSCHRAVEEARLAAMVLHGTAPLPSPPDLASRIKAAARTRLCHRPRPLHERALGSPAFMATCASLLCGAIICLAAILRVGAVPPEAAPAQWVAPPLEVHSLVTVAPIDQPGALHASLTAVTSRRPLAVRNVDHSERRLLVLDLPAAHTPVALPPRPVATPRAAASERRLPVTPAARDEAADLIPASTPAPAAQRTSLPDLVQRPLSTRPGSVDDLPVADTRFSSDALVGPPATRDLPMETDR